LFIKKSKILYFGLKDGQKTDAGFLKKAGNCPEGQSPEFRVAPKCAAEDIT
tara:strand:- start:3095 stop:3247 length:153 start_codon:yes stop_codon:yes gene_type:complete